MPLKIALTSYSGYGFWFALRLLEEGHKLNIYLTQPEFSDILGGIVPTPLVASARGSFPAYDKYDLSIFDLTGRKRQAEFSMRMCPTIGDGAFNCQAEDDRLFGLLLMEQAGIDVPPYERFTDTAAAKVFINELGKRFVYKPDGGQDNDTDTTYVSSSAEDMLGNLERLFARTNGVPFILQEFIKGTEVSTEGYFNGEEFFLVNSTLEEKKFLNENHGPNTGCAGNLVFPLAEDSRLFRHGLKKMESVLATQGYRGMIDINTIVTDNGRIYGLEWTPRFGYDATATMFHIYGGDLGNMLHAISIGEKPELKWKAEYSAATRVSIPPYPSEIKGKHPEGIQVKGLDPEAFATTYMYDLKLEKKQLLTAGHTGFLCCPLSRGSSIDAVWANQKELLGKLKIPNMQFRTDLGQTTKKRYLELSNMGLL